MSHENSFDLRVLGMHVVDRVAELHLIEVDVGNFFREGIVRVDAFGLLRRRRHRFGCEEE